MRETRISYRYRVLIFSDCLRHPPPLDMATTLLLAATAIAIAGEGRPNFIFMLADDWGYGDTSP